MSVGECRGTRAGKLTSHCSFCLILYVCLRTTFLFSMMQKISVPDFTHSFPIEWLIFYTKFQGLFIH